MDLLRGAADGQRPPWPAPRVGPGVQGPLPPLPDDAGPRRPSQGRLGLPWPPGRDRGREGARAHQQARDRGLRRRRVHPALPRLGFSLRRGLGRPHRALRCVDRHQGRVLDAVERVHRVGLVDHPPDVGQGPDLRGPPRHALLPAVRHRPRQPRGRAGLPGRRRSVGVRALPDRRGRPRRGPARVDDHSVDAGVERRGRGRCRHPVRPAARRGPRTRPRARRGCGRAPLRRDR